MPANVDIFTALRSYITGLVPNVAVIKGLGNDVALPVGEFISMTSIGRERLASNNHIYVIGTLANTTLTTIGNVSLSVQIDCYGPHSQDQSVLLHMMWLDQYAYSSFDSDNTSITPLYAEQPRQLPLIDAENNYEERWVTTFTIQYNPQLVTVIGYLTHLALTQIEIK